MLSAFNLNIELTAPECMVPDMKYWQKFAFIEMLPLAFVLILLGTHMFILLYKLACLNKSKTELYAHKPALISTCIVMFRLLFLNLTRTSMDVMNCAPTDVRKHSYTMICM
jgi:competence protein ComGF